eukprot:GEZU01010674.1.p1 GENE.GEZU01010674.1~~GEZU01010674.1.p1  ORF type:complete len:362 (+),score=82.92 GEZU01010674.1:75-1160(+)
MGGGAIDDYPQHPYTDGDVTMADMAAGLKEVDPLSFASTEELEQELARRKRLGLIKQDDKKFGKSIAVPQGLSPTEEERLSQIAIQNMLAEEQQHVATEAKKSMSKEAAKRMQSAHTHSALFYTCSLCTHKIKVDFTHTISTCSHVFCRDCLASYAKTQIDIQELPITCPLSECKKEIPDTDLEILLDGEYLQKFNKASVDAVVNKNPFMFSCCPTPGCGYQFVYYEGDDPHFRCEKCKKHYCLHCHTAYHTNMTCIAYKKKVQAENKIKNYFGTFGFSGEKKFKECRNCKYWVEKQHGRNHMACKNCGHQFCFHCGQSYPCTCGRDEYVKQHNTTPQPYFYTGPVFDYDSSDSDEELDEY